MPRRRKLELWIADMRKLAVDPSPRPRTEGLHFESMWLRYFCDRLSTDPSALRAVADLVVLIREGPGSGRQVAEEEILGYLGQVASLVDDALEDAAVTISDRPRTGTAMPPEDSARLDVIGVLADIARQCLDFVRPRDAFGGRRRALPYDILRSVSPWMDLPDVLARAVKASRKAGSVESVRAEEFLLRYLEVRDLPWEDKVIDDLTKARK